MESTVLYIKKYAIYSLLFLLFFECMMFLPCLGYQNKQEVLILFLIYQYLSIQLSFFSAHIFYITHTF